MVTTNLAQNLEDLHCELSCGTEDECSKTVHGTPFLAEERLQQRDKEGKGLAAACSCCAEYITSCPEPMDQPTSLKVAYTWRDSTAPLSERGTALA